MAFASPNLMREDRLAMEEKMRLKRRKCEYRSTFLIKLSLPICTFLLICSAFIVPWPIHKMEVMSYARRRTALYEIMAADLEKNGLKVLKGGSTSQSLSVSDIFLIKDGKVQPILKSADPTVRATVLYLDPSFAMSISDTVKRILSPYFPTGIWYQDPKLYHFSMVHASHHLEPVLATPFEIEKEAHAVEIVASRCCELWIVLEKIVLTSTGVLLGCWQVSNGTDPAIIRRELKRSLPNAPSNQLYDEVMLHTSFARVVEPSTNGSVGEVLPLLQKLVLELNRELHHNQARVTEMWFVEELDVLALALNGHMKAHKFPMKCHNS